MGLVALYQSLTGGLWLDCSVPVSDESATDSSNALSQANEGYLESGRRAATTGSSPSLKTEEALFLEAAKRYLVF